MTEHEEKEIEQMAWETFAEAHPHEAHATWPERFWEFFHAKLPHVTREQMECALKETENPLRQE